MCELEDNFKAQPVSNRVKKGILFVEDGIRGVYEGDNLAENGPTNYILHMIALILHSPKAQYNKWKCVAKNSQGNYVSNCRDPEFHFDQRRQTSAAVL